MPSEANTASKEAPYLVSRSRMRNRKAEIRSSRSAMRLRAACVVHAVVGCAVTPRMWTRRLAIHDEQHVETAQPGGVEVEEVGGQQSGGLGSDEGAPVGVGSARCWP